MSPPEEDDVSAWSLTLVTDDAEMSEGQCQGQGPDVQLMVTTQNTIIQFRFPSELSKLEAGHARAANILEILVRIDQILFE